MSHPKKKTSNNVSSIPQHQMREFCRVEIEVETIADDEVARTRRAPKKLYC